MKLKHYNIKKGQAHNSLQDVLDLLEVLKVVKPKRWLALLSKKEEIRRK